ncbi:hypothetical protein Tco_0606020 [Tanacetum coccineum]
MHKNKSANINPANYRLYHALMEALIEDGNAMYKEVVDTVKDHKRKHDGDDDDDDDDEGPLTGLNQGKSTKKIRTRESESAKKPSTTKETSKGKDPNEGSKTGKSAPAKDPVEEPTDKVIMDEQPTKDIPISDEGHVSDPEDTDNAYMPKNPHAKTFCIRKQKEPGKPKEVIYSNSKIIQVIKTYWELGHEYKFITEIVARRANECIMSITEPDYKNLNKNDIEDMYLLIMN